MPSPDKTTGRGEGEQKSSAPSISLPKGGGAIRGLGEKFAANPVTGTGSMSVPLATSPGRSGFGPQLALSYDSGSGNGPFGFGWSLRLPSITRKTEKGLPKYQESDVFILSGAEDLVPVLVNDCDTWVRHAEKREIDGVAWCIQRYRPRIEGLFARIERWTRESDEDVHWRSISKDNITTLYGKTVESRIADPNDSTRIFSWLICQSYDDKGNAIIYEYDAENSDGIDCTQTQERNRTNLSRSANRYLKRIKYGNRSPNRDADWNPTDPGLTHDWLFEVVFDYGEGHHTELPLDPSKSEAEQHRFVSVQTDAASIWPVRQDPFSSYRAGFEVRTYRLCRRVLMFHHFPDELGIPDYLVRSTEFAYAESPIASFISSVTQSGYLHRPASTELNRFLRKSLPPLEFEYSAAQIQETVREVDPESLENLPYGLDGSNYQWVDLDGEGLSGILTEQADSWFYKRNISPAHSVRDNGSEHTCARFGPVEFVATKPAAALAGGQVQFMDLAGDGQVDLVQLEGPVRGFYERTEDRGWASFRPFVRWPNIDSRDPNLRFIDLDGDGHNDILISEDEVFSWHASLAEEGYGPAARVSKSDDEEKGPRLVFADDAQSIYLADLSGDGLTDLVRIRNGEVCYWPNLGHGRFGAKVTMDQSPRFDHPDQFDQRRIRLGDLDGSGTTDIFYLSRDGIAIWRNHSGNSWGEAARLSILPPTENISSMMVVDLLGNGTACLVWSSPLPVYVGRQMRYVDLMGGQKPHLLVKTINNLGAETRVHYSPSTKFYIADKLAAKPWITRLPFPVHVVERVETYDHISRNRFVTRYLYHHGYFDGCEREFRGFGMVEQWDTEELAAFSGDGTLSTATNADTASHVPPVYTKTWFHTGIYLGRDHVSNFYAGLLDAQDKGEYYREPGLTDAQARALLLPDTVLPSNLTLQEEREACRALKGSMLRREVYALDGPPKAEHPYIVSEQNFSVRLDQPLGGNRYAVFFSHPREAITHHYERNPADPRVQHAVTLEVDPFGNVVKEAAIGYGRRQPDPALPLDADRIKQTGTLVTYTENRVTSPIDDVALFPYAYRTSLPCETHTYELTGYTPTGTAGRFQSVDFVQTALGVVTHVFDTEIAYEELPTSGRQRRSIEHIRTLYRADDLASLLPLGQIEPLALPGESYNLAFTPGLLARVFHRDAKPLLPHPADVLGGQAADRGGYLPSQQLKADARFPNTDSDDQWWIPSGRMLLSPESSDTPAQELGYARNHFFLPHRMRDPFFTDAVSTESFVTYDAYDLLIVGTRDALGNRVTVGERGLDGTIAPGNDYRVLQPSRVMDPNRNRTQVAFDVLGMVVGTAVMGKPEESQGDTLDGFTADLSEAATLDHLANPLADPHAILVRATTRLIYVLFAYQRTKHQPHLLPAVVYTLARETHDVDLVQGQQTKVQHSFSYSDGFAREIQKKIQAEPGPLVAGGPVVGARWVGSGWTIFNNKGKPVRQYEPFFSTTHRFEFGVEVGVSPILFYDPVERVVATLHPNHTYEKVVFDPWQQTSWDVNDTVLGDPRTDADIRGYTAGYFSSLPTNPPAPAWQTWHAQRQGGALGRQEQIAADKAAHHADTPTTVHLDTLGRHFLTLADNGADPARPGQHSFFATRVELDIEGNQRAVRDAIEQAGDPRGRLVMRYAYDMLGNRVYQLSMEAGARWMLNDATGKPIRAWDSRGHSFRTEYDPLRRPLRSLVTSADPANPTHELLTERLVYGEQHPEAELRNLRGKSYLHLDQAGAVISEDHDFKGNPLRASRRIGTEYKQTLNWNTVDAALPHDASAIFDPGELGAALAPRLESDAYTSSTTYDALDRPVTLTTPHTPAMQPSVIRHGYNEANLLERVDVNLCGATSNGEPVWTPFVTGIDYDAKGQRQRIGYGNGATTSYDYDPLTFRLIHLLTRRSAVAFPTDCPDPPPAGWTGCQLQNLHYTYDPGGNITHIRDDAQQTLYFRNRRIEPSANYTYDPLYRLIDATGREHLGQIDGAPIPHSHNDAPRVGINWAANDGNAMGSYVERYLYDAVGNLLGMQHRGNHPAHAGWIRRYAYDEPSLIENGTGGDLLKTSNRLSRTTVGSSHAITERYLHDAHGNMIRMPHLGGAHPAPNMHWDYRDQLRQTDLGGGGMAYYIYDAAGQRVRKVWEKSAKLIEERIYLAGFEIFRRRQGTERLERETLHIMDGKDRVALVETRTVDTTGKDAAPSESIRYQFGNHLGSASLELDAEAQIISYEEYTPYGSTSYQAVRSQTETPKRYRYTAKERDEESGLYHHGVRYYAPWLGRWTSYDPAGTQDGTNLFAFARSNPVMNTDSTGAYCDPTTQSCIDPTAPTQREEALQQCLPEGERHLPPVSSSQPETNAQPTAQPTRRVISPPPPVSPTDYTLFVPQGVLYTQYQTAVREADNSDNPWYVRGGMFVLGALASPLALAEEYVARPLTNVPFVVHNAGIKIGEHSARAYLWADQGEYAEATVDVLEGIVSFSHGFVAAGSVAVPIAGAVESRAVRVTTTLVETEVATTVSTGENLVYRSVGGAGEVNYVGITNSLERRAAEHLRSKGISIDAIPGLGNLARPDARAVEQVLIEYHGLLKNGGTLINKINSIASSNPAYAAALRRGAQLLKQAGYPGF